MLNSSTGLLTRVSSSESTSYTNKSPSKLSGKDAIFLSAVNTIFSPLPLMSKSPTLNPVAEVVRLFISKMKRVPSDSNPISRALDLKNIFFPSSLIIGVSPPPLG